MVPDVPGLLELGWGLPPEPAMGSVHVVVDPPVLDEHLGLEERVEELAVQELVPHAAVE